MECKAEWQRHQIGSKNPNWNPEAHVTRHCIVCGQEFTIKAKQLKLPGGGKFCSRECFGQTRRLKWLWNNPNLSTKSQKKQAAHREDPEYRERHMQATLRALLKRPTSLEQRLIKFFDDHDLPFRYVGDGSLLIGYKNPDFINTDGRKLAIEVSNAFFHKDKPNWAVERKHHFAKYGWDCIVLETDKGYLDEQFLLDTIGAELAARGIYT
ncbi:MAG: hypothetical protein ACOC58_04965 [Chloroflexota bacterium]